MPIPVPSLDDRSFDDLVAEALRMIPKLSREWTDHNPSDPGITLVELFAWLMDTAIYRLDRVPEKTVEHFLQMVGTTRNAEPLASAVQRALRALSERTRAVTLEDVEALAMQAEPTKIARVGAGVTPDGRIRIVVVPAPKLESDSTKLVPDSGLVNKIQKSLEPRRLITARLEVSGPEYVSIGLYFRVVRDPASVRRAAEISVDITERLWTFFHPLIGGWDGRGWEFGRNVYRTELFQLIERVEGVDHVEEALLNPVVIGPQRYKGVTEVSVPPLGLVSAERKALFGQVDEPAAVAQ